MVLGVDCRYYAIDYEINRKVIFTFNNNVLVCFASSVLCVRAMIIVSYVILDNIKLCN